MKGLGDTSSISSLLAAAAAKYGLDPNLLSAVATQESGQRQYTASGALVQSKLASGAPGAIGVMQLMPATAASLGVDPTDTAQNIDGGAKLLSQLLTRYNGDTSLALAAYNAGPSAVSRYNGVPPFAETQNYVASILAKFTALGGGSAAAPSPIVTDDSGDTSTDSSGGGFSLPDPSSIDPMILVGLLALGVGVVVAVSS